MMPVHNAEAYSRYTARSPGIVVKYDGAFTVRAGQWTYMSGRWHGTIEEYQAIVGLRPAASSGSVFIVEGAG